MNKTSQNNRQIKNSDYNGPTLQELEILLNRIEELDAKRDRNSDNSNDTKQAA
tara:strand:- start:138 stop:296 length:159 start_codon:yes stop_codon:yes gene_type:complete